MRHVACVVVLCVALTSSLKAQATTGAVIGTVTDASEGVIVGASVRIIHVETGFAQAVLTDGVGDYRALQLPVGEYRIEVQRDGFKTYVRTGIRVEVDRRAVLDILLEVGSPSEEVIVNADAPILHTQSAAVGTVVDNRTILQLPLNGRDFFQLATLVGGVVPAAERSQNSTQGGAVSVNGVREQSNNFLLDGVDNNDLLINQVVVQPSVDVVQEFKIQTSTYAAEFGRSAGGQFSVITRSGTNQWRGSGYEFFRNSTLDARNFFDDRRAPTPQFNRNQFGGTIGGPLRTNRVFMLANYEGLRARQAFTRIATVPPAAWLRGDFSSLLTGRVNPQTGLDTGQIFDPRTFQPISGNRIPLELLSAPGVALARAYPAPDDPTATGPTIATVQPIGHTRTNQFTVRVDYLPWAGSSLFSRYTQSQQRRENPFDPFVDPTNVPGFGSLTKDRNHSFVVGLTKPFRNGAVNEFRFGFNRYNGGIFQEQTDDVATALGITGLTTVEGHAGRPGVILGITDPLIDPYNTPQDRHDTTFHLVESFSWSRARHTFKAGGEVRRFALDYYLDLYARGQLTFVGLSGNPVADLLMGVPTVALRMNPSLDTFQNVRTTATNVYIQDDWRVTDALTVNAGVRYEYAQPPYETQNRFSIPDLTSAAPTYRPVGVDGTPRSGFDDDRNNVAPRVGLAWRMRPSVVVRGGYGVFYDSGILNLNIFPRYNPPHFALDLFVGPRPIQSAFSGTATPLTAANGIERDYRDGYYHQFSGGLQFEIARLAVAEVAYIGSRGRNLQLMRDLNQGRPGGPPFRNPAFGPARVASSSGWSTYDAVQVRLDRRFLNSISLLGVYTRSRSLDIGSSLFGSAGSSDFPQDSFNVEMERGPSSFDAPHRLVISYVLDIPSGAGFASNDGPLNALFRGWTVAGILTYQSGRPFTVYYGASANYSGTDNGANGGAGFDRPNQIGDPSVKRDPARWFSPAAFTPPRDSFGDVGRNTLRGDSIKNVDVALYRTMTVGRGQVQFRAEVFNAFNRPFFYLPVADLSNANAGRVTRAGDARQIQLGVRLAF